jgi:hypothetical protein
MDQNWQFAFDLLPRPRSMDSLGNQNGPSSNNPIVARVHVACLRVRDPAVSDQPRSLKLGKPASLYDPPPVP